MAVDPQQISLSMNDAEDDERLESIPDEGGADHYGYDQVSVRASDVSVDQCCSKATVLLADDLVFNMIPVERILSDDYGLKCDKASDGH